jgi:NAD(P)H-hydrate epimerase
MESAGSAVAEEIHVAIKDKRKKVLLLIGPGNNGADGFVITRILKRKGFLNVRAVVIKEAKNPSATWSLQKEKALNSGVEILQHTGEHLKLLISDCDVIVESILGTGFSSRLPEELVALVQLLNSKKVFVVAVDSPLGLDVNTGMEMPVALRADLTVTLGLAKPGFFVARGPRSVGKLKIHSIGFPKSLLAAEATTHFAWGERASKLALPKRDELSNKSDHGSVHVIAGSLNYPGAGLLTANAAGRAGSGYVYLSSHTEVYSKIQMIPEVIYRPLSAQSLKALTRESTVVLGPGLGTGPETLHLIQDLLKRKFVKVILDADALTVCADAQLWPLPKSWIITPHSGELGKILGQSAKSLNADRFLAAQIAAQKCGCVVLFKGFRSVISDGEKSLVILSGNSALAKAGSGDVLSGFIAAFRAQDLAPLYAAATAAYIHGRLAKEWIREGKDIISLLPSDLIHDVPNLIGKIRHSQK